MGRFKLEKSAKLWWKNHCLETGVDQTNITWEYLKEQLKENYQNRTYQVERLNKFLDCSQSNLDIEGFYQKFLKLLKYAPTGMLQHTKVARFVSRLNSPLKERLQSLRLTTFTDVLDAGRPIEQELNQAKKKGVATTTAQPHFSGRPELKRPASQQRMPTLSPPLRMKANRENLCYNCFKPGHHRKDCPILNNDQQPSEQQSSMSYNQPRSQVSSGNNYSRPPTYPNRQVQPQPNQRGIQRPMNSNNNQGNRANLNPQQNRNFQGGVCPNNGKAKVNQIIAEGIEVEDEEAHIHAAIEHQGANNQFSVLQTPAEYEGTQFTLLIDSGSTHSFISPRCICSLKLPEISAPHMSVKLATGKITQSITSVGTMHFNLAGNQTTANFRVLPLGVYDGILGMDWLISNHAIISCKEQNLSFRDVNGNTVLAHGKNGKPQLHLVTLTKLAKGLQKRQMVYAVTLNPTNKEPKQPGPQWLDEYADIFPEELTQLPPQREVDHAIELILGSQPIAK